ncbi:hypothetical protein CLOSTMETH_01869 [[Clostridium] methylpentosum DSM 5476]|uniref:Uncharacterized protein n=1 Tax=[Clostridium] methylpentosum DSM 5476 TaxID=537013 RepID=C0EDE2_9FIRM|nr:hypothetical protein CLOSTMETH_01869 [[Clostridium] methylpentosum DSM 5476]
MSPPFYKTQREETLGIQLLVFRRKRRKYENICIFRTNMVV